MEGGWQLILLTHVFKTRWQGCEQRLCARSDRDRALGLCREEQGWKCQRGAKCEPFPPSSHRTPFFLLEPMRDVLTACRPGYAQKNLLLLLPDLLLCHLHHALNLRFTLCHRYSHRRLVHELNQHFERTCSLGVIKDSLFTKKYFQNHTNSFLRIQYEELPI